MTVDVIWRVNGIDKEVLRWNIPVPLAYYVKREAQRSTYRIGKIIFRNNKTKQIVKS